MSTPRRLAVLSAVALATVALPAPSPPPEGDGWEQLRSLPRERRQYLLASLQEFDALSPAVQQSLRAFDRALAAEPDVNRENYFAALRRYHLWVQSLPESRRNELTAAPAGSRLALAEKFRAEGRSEGGVTPTYLQIADFRSLSPFDLAYALKVWLALTPAEQAAVSRLPEADRRPRLTQLGREKKLEPLKRPTHAAAVGLYEQAARRYPPLKKAEEAKQPEKAKQRIGEHAYFVANPPAKVPADRLLAFDRSLPPWVRNGYDTLPPDEARRRLAILYRLVVPDAETAAPKVPAKSATAPAKAGPTLPPPRPVAPSAKKSPAPPTPGRAASPF